MLVSVCAYFVFAYIDYDIALEFVWVAVRCWHARIREQLEGLFLWVPRGWDIRRIVWYDQHAPNTSPSRVFALCVYTAVVVFGHSVLTLNAHVRRWRTCAGQWRYVKNIFRAHSWTFLTMYSVCFWYKFYVSIYQWLCWYEVERLQGIPDELGCWWCWWRCLLEHVCSLDVSRECWFALVGTSRYTPCLDVWNFTITYH